VTKGMAKLLEREPSNANECELQKRRLKKLRREKEKLEGATEMLRKLAEGQKKARINITDKDAVVMSHKDRTKKPATITRAQSTANGITVAVQTTMANDNADDLEKLNAQCYGKHGSAA